MYSPIVLTAVTALKKKKHNSRVQPTTTANARKPEEEAKVPTCRLHGFHQASTIGFVSTWIGIRLLGASSLPRAVLILQCYYLGRTALVNKQHAKLHSSFGFSPQPRGSGALRNPADANQAPRGVLSGDCK